jgi:hypothetical protein
LDNEDRHAITLYAPAIRIDLVIMTIFTRRRIQAMLNELVPLRNKEKNAPFATWASSIKLVVVTGGYRFRRFSPSSGVQPGGLACHK